MNTNTFTDKLEVSVTITNTGNTSGKEVVQLYLTAPQDKVDKPVIELKAFDKTKVLKPNSSQTVKFILNPKDLASFIDDDSAWVVEKGVYTIKIGTSSLQIKQTANFTVAQNIIAEKVHDVFKLDIPMNAVLKY
ncbi:hypothetical protein NBRC110019_28090 [Neptunitalea chrysea]|uniref:Fibronectin type III-like domain-containing protein n=1 Tax=Neptunitalea chrysea TaxID=1647581 RepID=A0A9W6EWV4_9FLAO|nr:fibronectin type III-like domain-contianing protein [Neptunitalea chrysea]GLB53768.1 hypothetical protein NBRC110019_28090 [Neptunitalea chrysea]